MRRHESGNAPIHFRLKKPHTPLASENAKPCRPRRLPLESSVSDGFALVSATRKYPLCICSPSLDRSGNPWRPRIGAAPVHPAMHPYPRHQLHPSPLLLRTTTSKAGWHYVHSLVLCAGYETSAQSPTVVVPFRAECLWHGNVNRQYCPGPKARQDARTTELVLAGLHPEVCIQQYIERRLVISRLRGWPGLKPHQSVD